MYVITYCKKKADSEFITEMLMKEEAETLRYHLEENTGPAP